MPVTAVRDEGALRMWVCRLPVHIGPAGCTGFTEIFGETEPSHWADRAVGPYGEISMHSYPVGADDSVRPQDISVLRKSSANPYFPASFERKAFLQQILNRSYSQIWCTITGGAYQIARRVSTCVRNICKSDSCLNCTRRTHQTRPSAPFLPILFRQDGKDRAVGDIPQYHIPTKVPNQTGELP